MGCAKTATAPKGGGEGGYIRGGADRVALFEQKMLTVCKPVAVLVEETGTID